MSTAHASHATWSNRIPTSRWLGSSLAAIATDTTRRQRNFMGILHRAETLWLICHRGLKKKKKSRCTAGFRVRRIMTAPKSIPRDAMYVHQKTECRKAGELDPQAAADWRRRSGVLPLVFIYCQSDNSADCSALGCILRPRGTGS